MKRSSLFVALLASFLLAGCPIFPDNDARCFADTQCAAGFVCDQPTGLCVQVDPGSGQADGTACSQPSDCDVNQTCSTDGVCKSGDCFFHGCVSGFTCEVVDQAYTCVAQGGGISLGGSGGDAGAPMDGGAAAASNAGAAGAASTTGGAAGAASGGAAGATSGGAAGAAGSG